MGDRKNIWAMKIIVIADTHVFHQLITIPDGDVLVVAGDICSTGSLDEIADFNTCLLEQPCKHKIAIAGNHDEPLQSANDAALRILSRKDSAITYLQDNLIKIEGGYLLRHSLDANVHELVFYDLYRLIPFSCRQRLPYRLS